jgi:serine/threonine protein kinase
MATATNDGIAAPIPAWQTLLRQLANALADLLPPHLGDSLLRLFDRWADQLGVAAALARGRVVTIANRRLAYSRILGEGGYATVYLARDADDPAAGRRYALKRVADGASASAQLEEAALMDVRSARRQHPGVVPLLGAAKEEEAAAATTTTTARRRVGGARDGALLLLFPAYEGGTLQEEIERQRRRRWAAQQQQQRRQQGQRPPHQPPPPLCSHLPYVLPARRVLSVAAQVASALAHVHSCGWVHRDCKPHNVMRPAAGGGGGGGSGVRGGRWPPARRRRHQAGGGVSYGRIGQTRMRDEDEEGEGEDESDDFEDGGRGDEDEERRAAEAGAGAAAAASADVEMASLRGRGGRQSRSRQDGYSYGNSGQRDDDDKVVLIDFGSAVRCPQPVPTRADARLLQEECEAHVTATYRAPELFDPPSCPCDDLWGGGAVDVYALGCLLFACMHGAAPYEPAAGSSVALAALSGRVPWPAAASSSSSSYPPALLELVKACLSIEPARRPSAAAVEQAARELLGRLDDDDQDEGEESERGGGGV